MAYTVWHFATKIEKIFYITSSSPVEHADWSKWLTRVALEVPPHYYSYDQNPSGFCFLVWRAFFRNLSWITKFKCEWKTKGILVVNGLFLARSNVTLGSLFLRPIKILEKYCLKNKNIYLITRVSIITLILAVFLRWISQHVSSLRNIARVLI